MDNAADLTPNIGQLRTQPSGIRVPMYSTGWAGQSHFVWVVTENILDEYKGCLETPPRSSTCSESGPKRSRFVPPSRFPPTPKMIRSSSTPNRARPTSSSLSIPKTSLKIASGSKSFPRISSWDDVMCGDTFHNCPGVSSLSEPFGSVLLPSVH
jgi:hypothetical protein